MNQEKHANGETSRKSGKPVIIYIMILFIAAFLLMALSFVMHQRSNEQAMGNLETSFHSTLEDIQENQEKLLELQSEMESLEDQLEDAQTHAAESDAALAEAEGTRKAMEQLYCLQQEYSSGDYAGCKTIIEAMEASGATSFLSSSPINTENGVITAPFVRFQQLKYAALERLAEQTETAE